MARAKRLKYTGEWIERRDPEGNIVISGPSVSFPGVPAKDLDEADVAALSDEQYRDAVKSGVYVDPDAPKPAAKKSAAKKSSAKKPAASKPAVEKPVSAEEASAEQAKHVDEADAGVSDEGGSRSES